MNHEPSAQSRPEADAPDLFEFEIGRYRLLLLRTDFGPVAWWKRGSKRIAWVEVGEA